ncbi:MAG: hypothetical protein ACKOYM_04785 [Actinomycetes bacterium]
MLRSHRSVVRTGVVVITVACLAATSACSSSDESAEKASTTSSTVTPTTMPTTTTLDDASYGAFYREVRSSIQAAGTDRCKLEGVFAELSNRRTTPANPAQMKQAITLTAEFLTAFAAAAPPALAQQAATVRRAAVALVAKAKATNYSMDTLDPAVQAEVFNQDFAKALQAIETANAKDCPPGGKG